MKRKAKKTPKTKRCPKCQTRKPLAEFARCKTGKYGRQSWCKVCQYGRLDELRDARVKADPVMEWARKMVASARARCKKKPWDCRIDKHDIVEIYHEQRGLCAITGIEMEMAYGVGRCDRHMSIDRIDNDRGYEPGNIRLVCDRANLMRGTMSDYELAHWCQAILTHATTDMDTVSESAAPIEPFGDIDLHSDL